MATTERFERDAAEIWSDAEINDLILSISKNPLQGELIPSTGGLQQAALGQSRHGQARRCKGDYLCDQRRWEGVAVDRLCQSGARQSRCRSARQAEKETNRWLN